MHFLATAIRSESLGVDLIHVDCHFCDGRFIHTFSGVVDLSTHSVVKVDLALQFDKSTEVCRPDARHNA